MAVQSDRSTASRSSFHAQKPIRNANRRRLQENDHWLRLLSVHFASDLDLSCRKTPCTVCIFIYNSVFWGWYGRGVHGRLDSGVRDWRTIGLSLIDRYDWSGLIDVTRGVWVLLNSVGGRRMIQVRFSRYVIDRSRLYDDRNQNTDPRTVDKWSVFGQCPRILIAIRSARRSRKTSILTLCLA